MFRRLTDELTCPRRICRTAILEKPSKQKAAIQRSAEGAGQVQRVLGHAMQDIP
jgi:hypothetical protein